ncbi:hypothetical protein IKP94_04485 [Candidatus Saccharibacteria bacterium]|nr:hypothetical protein [Candidatus Saccharibacteria bacterium]
MPGEKFTEAQSNFEDEVKKGEFIIPTMSNNEVKKIMNIAELDLPDDNEEAEPTEGPEAAAE